MTESPLGREAWGAIVSAAGGGHTHPPPYSRISISGISMDGRETLNADCDRYESGCNQAGGMKGMMGGSPGIEGEQRVDDGQGREDGGRGGGCCWDPILVREDWVCWVL